MTDLATPTLRHVFVRDLMIATRIGVYRHERDVPQRVRINIDLQVTEGGPVSDRLENVVSYEDLVVGVRSLTAQGHVNLVETLAEQIAELALVDPRTRRVRVRVEKLDVFADVGAVGVEIERLPPG